LIRQIIKFIPPTVDTLSVARFEALDRTLKTWKEGLSILTDVLLIPSPLLLIIIDGLEGLDFAECGEHYLVELLELLCRASSDGRGNALKLLFTTAGGCAALSDVLDEDTAVIVKCRGKGGRTVLGV
jgi:hypothetical protein